MPLPAEPSCSLALWYLFSQNEWKIKGNERNIFLQFCYRTPVSCQCLLLWSLGPLSTTDLIISYPTEKQNSWISMLIKLSTSASLQQFYNFAQIFQPFKNLSFFVCNTKAFILLIFTGLLIGTDRPNECEQSANIRRAIQTAGMGNLWGHQLQSCFQAMRKGRPVGKHPYIIAILGPFMKDACV